MNPPYSNPKPFIEKAWKDSKHCKIVCLVKCDPSTKWWATFWNYENKLYPTYGMTNGAYCAIKEEIGPKPGCEVRFFSKRIQFDPPVELVESGEVWKDGSKWVQRCDCFEPPEQPCCSHCKEKGYKPLSGPSFPCALVIMDRRDL